MQDEITITQVLAENLNQPLAVTAEMGIRKHTDFQKGRSFKGSEIIYRKFKKTSLFWHFTSFPTDGSGDDIPVRGELSFDFFFAGIL